MIDIKDIPFFKDKSITINYNIYSDDMFPCCFSVKDEAEEFKVRLFSKFNPFSIQREYNALLYLHKNNITDCPSIIAADMEGQEESNYLIESFLPGKSLEKYSQKQLEKYNKSIAEGLALIMIKLHSLHGADFHSFTTEHYNSYTDMLVAKTQKHISFISTYDYRFSIELQKFIDILFEYKTSMNSIIPTFLHFDFKPQNVIFDDNKSTLALIDFEHSRFGDPIHELIRADLKYKYKNNVYLNKIWSNFQKIYLKKTKTNITEERRLIYQLYYYISELPYLYKVSESDKLKQYHTWIKKMLISF